MGFFTVTQYRSLYDTTPTDTQTLTWEKLCASLSVCIETPDKFSVPGFGAHVLSVPSRHAANVTQVTLLVFDVDVGTWDDVNACLDGLDFANIAAHVYSSHSHTEAKPALRLIVPLARPITPAEYPAVRADFIQRAKVPCNAHQSGDVSRFWFLPSRPPGGTPFVRTLSGAPYEIPPNLPLASPPVAPKPYVAPPEPTGPLDLASLQERLLARSERLAKSPEPERQRKGATLRRFIFGEPLAEHGHRNAAMLSATSLVLHALPRETPLSVLMLLARPSLEAMQAEGSKLTESQVEGMFVRALEKRNTAATSKEEFLRALVQQKQAFEAAIPTIFKRSK